VTRRGWSEYDRRELKGFFRYVVIREGKFTGQRLVNLVTSSGDLPDDLAEGLRARFKIDGVTHLTTDSVADLSRGEVKRVWGRKTIEENLDGTILAMGPNSFFQPNSYQACVLYRDIAMHLKPFTRLLDLFCGVGSIGLYTGAIVTGVDNDAENIELARDNARRNNRRAEFVLRDAGQVEIGGFDAVVIDPPRVGLNPKLAARLNELGPDTVIYVSCNPSALHRDLGILVRYRIETLKAYDFCPHTHHVEMLCVLARR
jgi:tRNA/tmRNA/rRNA uracil-C5-methylase (TrmA/RlmC/RlmD family)